jgi:hypothetical protein
VAWVRAAAAAIGEARGIAERLGCQPLLARADSIRPPPPAPRPRDDGANHMPVTRPPITRPLPDAAWNACSSGTVQCLPPGLLKLTPAGLTSRLHALERHSRTDLALIMCVPAPRRGPSQRSGCRPERRVRARSLFSLRPRLVISPAGGRRCGPAAQPCGVGAGEVRIRLAVSMIIATRSANRVSGSPKISGPAWKASGWVRLLSRSARRARE